MVRISNIFEGIPGRLDAESFEPLVERPGLLIERIVSDGQATPPGEWLSEDVEEWVVLLTGSAGLRFEGEPEAVSLRPGDSCRIPAGSRHRVEWTDPRGKTVWIAVHYAHRG